MEDNTYHKSCVAFHSLSRVISFAMALSAVLDFVSKTSSTNQTLLLGIKTTGLIFFISLVFAIKNLINVKVSREVSLKCGDPIREGYNLLYIITILLLISVIISKKSNFITEWVTRIYCCSFIAHISYFCPKYNGKRIDF